MASRPFRRSFSASDVSLLTIGNGEIGGKAAGLLSAARVIGAHPYDGQSGRLRLNVARSVVITTDVFDSFMERNRLHDVALSGEPDERISLAFQAADFPGEYVGDLMALVSETAGQPLAVRSSSLLEDALEHPFAGVYQTKMIPNNQIEVAARFRSLVEAIKFVYASVFSHAAIAYIRAVGKEPRDEKMAVIIQEVVGRPFGDRFYPEVSGVCRTFSYYRSGPARPDEGVVSLALGLGKTIVDGGVSYSYSPAHPRALPPFSNVREMLTSTQLRFWAVNMGPPPAYDPILETEYLVDCDLDAAEEDDSLRHIASTYDHQNDRLVPGTGNAGPRVIDFAPLVRMGLWPVTDATRHLLEACRADLGQAVEIEFAVTFPVDGSSPARMSVLQVRPMAAPGARITVSRPDSDDEGVLVYSELVMGNGAYADIRDVVYVRPEAFDSSLTRRVAQEVESVNRALREDGRRYVLIGFGRWGTSDPWLGIPVTWGQISEASVIVESTLPAMNVQLSQGAHFFLNIESFRVAYFTVSHSFRPPIDWAWLESRPAVRETNLIRHVHLDDPLHVSVDGRTGRGVIRKHRPHEPGDEPAQAS